MLMRVREMTLWSMNPALLSDRKAWKCATLRVREDEEGKSLLK